MVMEVCIGVVFMQLQVEASYFFYLSNFMRGCTKVSAMMLQIYRTTIMSYGEPFPLHSSQYRKWAGLANNVNLDFYKRFKILLKS